MPTMTSARRSQWPVWLCWLAMVLDGFDLVVLGTVIPTLIKTGELGFDAVGATFAATISLVGVGLGALFIAPLSDKFGRRKLLIACVAGFSLFTLAVAFAPNVAVFSVLRLLAGLGLGACLPAALAYMNDYAPAGSAGKSTTRTMTGYHVGAVATALLAILIIPNWRLMFIIGGAAGLVLLPFLWAKLPESLPQAAPAPSADAAKAPAAVGRSTEEPKTGFRDLLRKPYPVVAVGIGIASFMGLLLVYGLNTWLPQLMAAAGYPVSTGLTLLLVLNLGAVAGLFLAGVLADKHGTKRIVLLWFGLSGVLLAILSVKIQNEFLLNAAVFVTGVFVFSSQVLVYAWVSQLFPAHLRGTGLGFAAGVGRLGAIVGPAVTGTLVAANIAYPAGFYVFAAAGLLALVALLVVPTHIHADKKAVPAGER
ncbi:aromatic acid/H+ symport family MFS transporter [Arthrobacter sp. TES]|uniref:MFS transporter n=1 Tax=Paenarthrobacter TaxID=1742992 RepID=UPI0008F8CAAF|nr:MULTISPECIES: aromatic acid/H+ symport family MFS transporter [Paenarthrobacter]QOI65158.1 aromatic acid/H+ symport family MFS transporter [Arthrobacter sp. TES]MBN9131442.1 aromatic acid/H+ symport family MFS transporter [Paenarthrobacter ureafaciens]MEC3852907.1 aromatic acid/H+ symport family MFS transporter [Paenarthrobacter ureafaciens]QSZ52378.1 MFS transporter [Paenarthrobacter ureafaciens]WOC60861.1 aromatic acid/H+ symport family MFS transporter [Paenarthrobacter sp. AT5]